MRFFLDKTHTLERNHGCDEREIERKNKGQSERERKK